MPRVYCGLYIEIAQRLNIVRLHHQSVVMELAQMLLSIGMRFCADLLLRTAGFQGVGLPS